MRSSTMRSSYLPGVPATCLFLLSTFSLALAEETFGLQEKKKIAVIGGGVGGTFATRFLAEFDAPCLLSAVDLFDPSIDLTGVPRKSSNPSDDEPFGVDWQGPRVSTLALEDGSTVELGASIIFGGNRIITEQVDFDLERAPPGSTGKEAASDPGGFGVYDGSGVWDMIVRDDEPDWKVALRLAWKYGLDLVKMRNAAKDAFASFEKIYETLDGPEYFSSPDDLWRTAGLLEATRMSFDEYLDSIGISGSKDVQKGTTTEWSWLRAAIAEFIPAWDGITRLVLPGHGSLRKELLDAININNYNQNNSQLDGLAGLVSFIPTLGDIYCVRHGNNQILSSAFRRAEKVHSAMCVNNNTSANDRATEESSRNQVLNHVKAKVTSVVFTDNGAEVWGNRSADGGDSDMVDERNVLFGSYDMVILAAPLQHAQIVFQTEDATGERKSLKLGSPNTSNAKELSRDDSMPPSTTRTYTQTVTTVVSNATLLHDAFGFSANDDVPRAISVTYHGKKEESFSALSRLSGADGAQGVFKIFSPERLTGDQLAHWFGPHYVVEHVKVWGGPHGGAYPDFAGGGKAVESVPFLLYGEEKGTGPSLFYVNAMESAVSAMEISAIGAKAVAKLAAKKLGMI